MDSFNLPFSHAIRIGKSKLLSLFVILFSGALTFTNPVSAQLDINSFTVFGGAQICSPIQLPLVPTGSGCRVHIGVGSVITGNVGSYHYVEANGAVTINGNIHSGGRVNLANGNKVVSVTAANQHGGSGPAFRTGNGAIISGDIDVAGDINVNVNGGSSVAGTVSHPALNTYVGPNPGGGEDNIVNLPILPVMPDITPLTCPSVGANIINTAVLAPNTSYNTITVGNNKTITFDGPGNYFFNSITVGNNVTFIYDFNGLGGKINIYICGNVKLGNGFNTTFAGSTNTPVQDGCRIYFEAQGTGPAANNLSSFIIGEGSDFYGKVWAPYGGIKIGGSSGGTFATGNLWSAKYVDVQHGVTIIPCECINEVTICKVFNGNGDAAHNPSAVWSYTSNIPGHANFTLPALGGCITFTGVPPGVYTVTEINQADPACPQGEQYIVTNSCGPVFNGATATFTVTDCQNNTCTFTNTPPDCQPPPSCQWCNKGAVLSQVWQNPGNNIDLPENRCIVPDILVDVNMTPGGANDVVTADEIGTGEPATWSIQAAINYVNAHYNDVPFPFDDASELFIGVTATLPMAPLPGDPFTCGRTCVRPAGGDNPYGTENVTVYNNTTARLNVFGCSVTMWPANAALPVFTVVQSCTGKITVLDLHVWNSDAAGYLVLPPPVQCAPGDLVGDLVTVKNSAAYYNDLGYDVRASNVEISGSQHIVGNRIGILVSGNNVELRSNKDVMDNTEAGIKITGNNNEIHGHTVGKSGHPNPVGIIVAGNNNELYDDDVFFNTGTGILVSGNNNFLKEDVNDNGGNGIVVSGDGNTLEDNDANENGLNGIHVTSTGNNNLLDGNNAHENGANGIWVQGSGNSLDDNQADDNTLQGIRACGQTDLGNNDGSGNGVNPQVDFACALGSFTSTTPSKKQVPVTVLNSLSAPGAVVKDAQVHKEMPIQVYPNPAHEKALVQFSNESVVKYTLKVVDMTGRTIMSYSDVASKGITVHEFNVSKLAKGSYLVVLEKENRQTELKKVVVQ